MQAHHPTTLALTPCLCEQNKIAIEAYSPLGKGAHVDLPELKEISKKYGKTAAQLLIRWSLQTGHICLVKSSNAGRIKENADIFDFVIDEDDFRKLDALETGSGITWDRECPAPSLAFLSMPTDPFLFIHEPATKSD